MTRCRALTFARTLERLRACRRPAVLIHTRPDGDCVGSGAALCRMLTAWGERPTLVCPDPVPARLAFLVEGIAVSDDLPADTDLSLTVDVAAPTQLGRLESLIGGSFSPAIMIDHHQSGRPFADHLIDPRAAACGEIVWRLLCAAGEERLTADRRLIDALYAAILSDTGCFRFSNTTPATLRIAARLLDAGADAAGLVRRLFFSKTPGQLSAEVLAATKHRTLPGGRVRWLALTRREQTEEGRTPDDFESAIEVLREIEGTDVALVARETADGVTKCSLRSAGLDVSAVCAAFGGGGHRCAAGCTVTTSDPEEAARILLEAIVRALGQTEA